MSYNVVFKILKYVSKFNVDTYYYYQIKIFEIDMNDFSDKSMITKTMIKVTVNSLLYSIALQYISNRKFCENFQIFFVYVVIFKYILIRYDLKKKITTIHVLLIS